MSDNGEVVDVGFEVQEDGTDGQAVAEQETPAAIPLLAASEREKLQALRQQQREAQREVEDCKSELKSAKLRLDACTDAISRYIDSLSQPELPFNQETTPEELEDAWRSVLLADAIGHAISPGTLEALLQAEIDTVGALAQYTSEHPLILIKGIGEAKAETIEKAMEAFWAARKASHPAEQDPAAKEENDG